MGGPGMGGPGMSGPGMGGPGGPGMGGPDTGSKEDAKAADAKKGKDPAANASGSEANAPHSTTMWVLEALRQEVVSVDPHADIPSQAELARIGREGGSLDAPAVRAALVRLKAASTKAGLDFPPSLGSDPPGTPAR
jgi:hypothetical protein